MIEPLHSDAPRLRPIHGPAEPRPEPTDEEILAAVRQGRTHAFDVLVARYGSMVRDYAGHLVPDHALADDLTQEALVRLLVRAGEGPVGPSLRVWLLTVVRRAALDQLRRRRVRFRFLERVRAGLGPGRRVVPAPPAELAGQEFHAAFARALGTLPEPQRTAFVLRERDGLSHGEIAAVLGCELKTVSSRLHRARAALQRALARHLGPEGSHGA